ncbi:alpha/beta hydrolase [Planctomyces sp. SH-PL62]|uniref:alpha/beta hydrolase n=1 Tax=Planctomyces sp. SH-PL62 TaxID=1636152 RepID=UPI0018D40FE3|nr:alpha/beta hydrolase-fold protein [Planctomyces sp. SH-PL62]
MTLPGARRFDIRAKSGLEYRIFVAAPPGPAPAPGFPVIYFTDGNENFPVLLAATRKQSREALQAVVVGIGYPGEDPVKHRERRAFDLTPQTSEEWMKSDAREMGTFKTGGEDGFLDFIETELKPVVERRHRIDRSRQTLFGHSFGGLFTLHVLFTRPETFQTYVAASPSLWWNGGSILMEEKSFLEGGPAGKAAARVLLTSGELERKTAPIESKERARLLENRRLAGSAKEMVDRMDAAGVPGLSVEYREFVEENHGSVVLPAASRGARFALDDGRRTTPPSGVRAENP